uniref:Uncharacterized protein n=1 Tax=viral metagenome TaxID=1070528 RepID=A0A6C0LTA1_9ZZZZ
MRDDINREKWHEAYIEELKEMYYNTIITIRLVYPNIVINEKEAFHNFSRLIFHCSSKRISEYTKAKILKEVWDESLPEEYVSEF